MPQHLVWARPTMGVGRSNMLRTVPLHRAANRPALFLGGDREVVMMAGVVAAALGGTSWDVRSGAFGAVVWIVVLAGARMAAKADPLLRHVYMRSRRYDRSFYPARATPFATPTTYGGGKPPRRYRPWW